MAEGGRRGCRSLQHLCIKSVGKDDYWRVQKRHVEALPWDLVDAIVKELTRRRRLWPTALFQFRDQLTQLHIRTYIADFIPMISKLHCLRSLVLTGPPSPAPPELRLRPLVALAPNLLELKIYVENLPACIGTIVGSLTSLTYLKLQAKMPDILSCLGDLQALKELHLARMTRPTGDLETSALSSLTSLRKLSLYECDGLTTTAVRELNLLTDLEYLHLSGKDFHAPPWIPSLTYLQLGHMELDLKEEDEILVWEDMKSVLPNLCNLVLNNVRPVAPRGTHLLHQLIEGASSCLTSLTLTMKHMPDDISNYLQCATNLKALSLSWCDSDPAPLGFPRMPGIHLESLILNSKMHVAINDAILIQAAKAQMGLTSLHLPRGNVSTISLNFALNSLPKLKSLSFEMKIPRDVLQAAREAVATTPGLEVSFINLIHRGGLGIFQGHEAPPLLDAHLEKPPRWTPLRDELFMYDERYRYTADELLALRVAGDCAVGSGVGATRARLDGVPSDLLAGSAKPTYAIE